MRRGVSPGGRHLFPAFPYPSFTKINDADIGAIFAFLRTLKAVRSQPPENGFYFRQRWAMAAWNDLFLEEGAFAADNSRSQSWNRGAYLVEALGHCGACHTPRNVALAERNDAALTGGVQMGEVAPGVLRLWAAPNLTGAQSGLAKWSEEDVRKYLKGGHSRRAGTLGPMNEVITGSLQHLTDEDAAAIAVYLKSLPAKGEVAPAEISDADRTAGRNLYDKHCDECHLSSGRGGFRKAPPVAGSAVVQAPSAASVVNIILYGAQAFPGSALDSHGMGRDAGVRCQDERRGGRTARQFPARQLG